MRSPIRAVSSECASILLSPLRSSARGAAGRGAAPGGAAARSPRPPGAGGRDRPFGGGAGHVGVRGDEARAFVDQADGLGEGVDAVGPGLAQHDEVGFDVGHHETHFV